LPHDGTRQKYKVWTLEFIGHRRRSRENPPGPGQDKNTELGTGNLRSQNAFASTNRHTFSIINPYLTETTPTTSNTALLRLVRSCRGFENVVRRSLAAKPGDINENRVDYTKQRRRVSHTCLLPTPVWAHSLRTATKCEHFPDVSAPTVDAYLILMDRSTICSSTLSRYVLQGLGQATDLLKAGLEWCKDTARGYYEYTWVAGCGYTNRLE
jgi:hypothetical protein